MTSLARTSPSAAYRDGVANGDWQDDAAQHGALRELDRIHAALVQTPAAGWLARWTAPRADPPRGLYLWGGVGRRTAAQVEVLGELEVLRRQLTGAFAGGEQLDRGSVEPEPGRDRPQDTRRVERPATHEVLVLDRAQDGGDGHLAGREEGDEARGRRVGGIPSRLQMGAQLVNGIAQ